jgi:hypothetical protein
MPDQIIDSFPTVPSGGTFPWPSGSLFFTPAPAPTPTTTNKTPNYITAQQSVKPVAASTGHRLKSIFSITPVGSKTSFILDLLPAVESKLRYPSQGTEVPNASQGIMSRTVHAISRFVIPGGAPVIQYVGIEGRIITYVGAFIGKDIGNNKVKSGYEQLQEFESTILNRGRRVEILVSSQDTGSPKGLTGHFNSDTNLVMKETGVIQRVVTRTARANRVYYEFELLVTDYDTCGSTTTTATTSGPANVPKPKVEGS